MDMLIEVVGWIGALQVLMAYCLITFGKINGSNKLYQWLNLVGSFLLIINTIYLKAYPSAFVNIIWVFIALAGILGKQAHKPL